MACVVFGFELLEVFLEFPGEDVGFGKEAGMDVGSDDTSLALGCDSAEGLASVLAGSSDLLLSTHDEAFLKMKKGSPEGLPFRGSV